MYFTYWRSPNFSNSISMMKMESVNSERTMKFPRPVICDLSSYPAKKSGKLYFSQLPPPALVKNLDHPSLFKTIRGRRSTTPL